MPELKPVFSLPDARDLILEAALAAFAEHGLRFVVLVSADIKVVERAITTCPKWTAVLARDYEEERRQRPYEFDYQSVHYIVRSKDELTFEGVTIAAGTPCEIQVRTILQHAYSELTHDTIYKPSVQASPDVKRSTSRVTPTGLTQICARSAAQPCTPLLDVSVSGLW